MAGLLDPKSRIVDAILTSAGKNQAFAGGLKIRYVTFSDVGSKYQGDANGIATMSSASIGFESFSNVWDNVTVETDESGYMLSFRGDDVTITPEGKAIVSGSINTSSSVTDRYVSSSLQSLENLQLIASSEGLVNDPGLHSYPLSHVFSVRRGLPFDGEPQSSSVDDVESFFADKRLSNLPNFKFLPPTQRSQAITTPSLPLGNYQDFSEKSGADDPFSALANVEGVSFELSTFTERHTLVMQLFEETKGATNKLVIIPYGAVGYSPEGNRSYMYFVGKVFEDGYGTPTYVNIFTMVIE